ncbi:MAG: TolC family protein [Clostridiales Family XIII bacterium]|jgi:hypothetical protein|nr:TolC family protein [Clostridiales Family XIII bacterium]
MILRGGARNRIKAVWICLAVAAAFFLPGAQMDARAADSPFTLAQAERLALSASPEIKKDYNAILLKRIKYTDAVTSIRVTMKNKQTLRWSPLLSFKLPEKLNLSDELDLTVKPLALTDEITTLQHKMADEQYMVLAKVRTAYGNAYLLQEKSVFTSGRLDAARQELALNTARLAVGMATQTDIDRMAQRVKTLTDELAQQLREFLAAKRSLSEIAAIDVSTGYRFLNPMREANLTRAQLDSVTQHTVDYDHAFYETRAAKSLAQLNLDTTESLMRGKYGGAMGRLNSFISASRQGQDVDTAAFQIAYGQMLTDVDSRWAGSYRILFFRFSKEFFKGQIDGTRYIEDEPYALFSACLEYATAYRDMEAAEKELRKQVAGDFENLVTAYNAYQTVKASVENAKNSLDQLTLLNKTGRATFAEVKDQQSEYEELQTEALDALSTYNELLIEFDRLSCGAVSAYFAGVGLDTSIGGAALSFPADDGKIWYYVYGDVSDLTFVFGLNVPDEFDPPVTEYELWYEGVNISGSIAADKSFRHLLLDYGDTHLLTVRLFSDGEYVGESEIDTTVPRAPLPIESSAADEGAGAAERAVGRYVVTTKMVGDLRISELAPEFDALLGARFYRLEYGGAPVYTGEPIAVGETLSYLTLLINDLADVQLLVFDADGTLICTARFDTSDGTIRATVAV